MEQTISPNRPQLDKLASSLAKAQAEFPPVPKTGKNPHLKNEYSTLDDIISAIRKPLANHGLAFVQLLGSNGEGTTTLRTVLLHESGQSLEATVVVDAGAGNRGVNALQSLGAAITYMKRYSLSAMLGISTDGDTDGEGTAPTRKAPTKARPEPKREPQPETHDAPGINSPTALMKAVNDATAGYYNAPKHMLHAIEKVTGEPASWPPAAAVDAYQELYGILIDYAEAQKAGDA